ncbi:hypothetical protein CQA48_30360, partial [Klebsiella pneumoniae]
PLPQLVHGGPGRAGGGEELGGLRSVKHYMQRTAVQGSPTMLATIGQPLPQLVHGGPGRAGGGEELGGLRSVKHYMQRTA